MILGFLCNKFVEVKFNLEVSFINNASVQKNEDEI